MCDACFTGKNIELCGKYLLAIRDYFSLKRNATKADVQFSTIHPKRIGSNPLFAEEQLEECSTTSNDWKRRLNITC